MITTEPDRTLSAARLASELARLRARVADRPAWRFREKYVDRGARRDPFYILDFAPPASDAGDDLLDEPLFATGAPALRVKHLTRQAHPGAQEYWRPIDSAGLGARLDRFLAMYQGNYLQPPGVR